MSAIAITTPYQYHLFQRSSLTSGSIPITGTYTYASAGHIEASFNGGTYADIATIASGTSQPYSGTLSAQTPWQGTLTVRIREEPATSTTQTHVGIGELITCSGQSNMSGRYTNSQSYSSTDGFDAVEYFGVYAGVPWFTWADGAFIDNNNSFIPRLATSLMNTWHVPVGFMPAPPQGGTTWTDWQPGADHLDTATLYGRLNSRAAVLGSTPRLNIMWLGESDAFAGTSQAACDALIDSFADALYADRGIKTMICKLQICPAVSPDSKTQAIRDAIAAAWADNSHVLTGPDFSDQTADDGSYHFTTNANCQMVADRWATALGLVISPAAGHFSTVFAGALR